VTGPYQSELHALELSVDSAPPSAAAPNSVPADGVVPPFPAQKLLDAIQTSVKVHTCRNACICPFTRCRLLSRVLLEKLSAHVVELHRRQMPLIGGP